MEAEEKTTEIEEKAPVTREKPPIFRKISKKKMTVMIVVTAVILMILGGTLIKAGQPKQEQILTESSLEKILDVSELSTFEAVYNGIAHIPNEKDTEKVNYYASYEAKVKLGINVDDVTLNMDEEQKAIQIHLPEISITEVNVDIGSLDYIFVNKKANTETVSQEAYKACIADATEETQKEQAIYLLAQQNAENIIKAMVCPFMEQMEEEYNLQISWEEM